MLDTSTVTEIKNILFKFLDPQKDRVFIFGSRAIGGARKFSDIDIGVKSTRELTGEILVNIKDAFEESNIPYTVDVVDFSQVSDRFNEVAKQKIIYLN
ncbi:conserved hypothetical protein [Candidatus Roizmanbacteria bacterium]|nr:conserved hypothetical protein [Candidatus Roizmanbacteria bacterium]